MSQRKFVNRVEGLEILERSYSSNNASLFILYGRKRVGKTELIKNFIQNMGVYFFATTEGDGENINNFKSIISKYLEDVSILKASFDNWYSLFSVLASNQFISDKIKGIEDRNRNR